MEPSCEDVPGETGQITSSKGISESGLPRMSHAKRASSSSSSSSSFPSPWMLFARVVRVSKAKRARSPQAEVFRNPEDRGCLTRQGPDFFENRIIQSCEGVLRASRRPEFRGRFTQTGPAAVPPPPPPWMLFAGIVGVSWATRARSPPSMDISEPRILRMSHARSAGSLRELHFETQLWKCPKRYEPDRLKPGHIGTQSSKDASLEQGRITSRLTSWSRVL